MSITPNTLEFKDLPPPNIQKYRIIHKGQNFVLLQTLLVGQEQRISPGYTIITVLGSGQPIKKIGAIRMHFCDYGMLARGDAFDWPKNKVLDAFKTTLCMSTMNINDSGVLDWKNWTLGLFQRVETPQPESID